jgi:hypothetical protein
MKNRVFATLSSLTLLTAAAAFAQSSTGIEADIPFEFHIGSRILPAGHYELRPQLIQGVLLVKCLGCRASALIVMNGADHAREMSELATLTFNRYDKTYFLSGVCIPEYSQGRQLSKSKAELEFVRNIRNGSPVPSAVVALVRR